MSSAEKTEKPTPQRLRKEARKGKSFSSRDLLAAAVLWIGMLMLVSSTRLQPVMDLYVDTVRGGFLMPPETAAWLALKALLWAIAPVLLASIACVALVSLAMSRAIMANEAVKLDFNRLNPVTGFKNLFSLKVVKDLARSVLYVLAAALFAWGAWNAWAHLVFRQVHAPDGQLVAIWLRLGGYVGAGLLLALAPVYLLSGWLDHRLFIREMKMEKREVKREHKENESPPELKKRRAEIAEELSAQVQADTLGSSLILANPTHIAIGIFLPDDEVPLPFVSVHEKGRRARKVIALAEGAGIPVVRDIRLARAIHASTRRYQFVHGHDIDGVMHVVRWLRDVERAAQPPPSSDVAGSPPAAH
ncbi:EscU/YscU/HrcU family type III secretion system export apparatus switch protein [Stenotrophomonas tumulicola]|uniref:EscU/YscU/HrcU family type III secretion system export apparatus switch protein n=1 Tax=Stenotrophomonas tumulicola TaxID=1685415 RepID=A0A7W3FM51_9GAMM|nr:EscU/YscU/HrcU family type III secretion system export apparatus switch protein [Stenotrophomonas tumulicola]MBA8682063.1 EscU/YscU/HrcU family type III secretion system export apparatus switch protein [Stenotrophomonas tumulicola]